VVVEQLQAADSFIVSTLQKDLLRELKININDTIVKNPEGLHWVLTNRQWAGTGPKTSGQGEDPPEDDDEGLPKEGSVTSSEKPGVPSLCRLSTIPSL